MNPKQADKLMTFVIYLMSSVIIVILMALLIYILVDCPM